MSTENTSLKNTTPAGDSNTTNEMVIGKSNTYQHPFLIIAGSLLVLLIWLAVAGKNDGMHLKSSTYEIAEGAGALLDYQLDTVNSAITKDIFDLDAVSENEVGVGACCSGGCKCGTCYGGCASFRYSRCNTGGWDYNTSPLVWVYPCPEPECTPINGDMYDTIDSKKKKCCAGLTETLVRGEDNDMHYRCI